MSVIGAIVLLTAVGVAGLLLALSGWLQPAPPLARVLDHLQRGPHAGATRSSRGRPGSEPSRDRA